MRNLVAALLVLIAFTPASADLLSECNWTLAPNAQRAAFYDWEFNSGGSSVSVVVLDFSEGERCKSQTLLHKIESDIRPQLLPLCWSSDGNRLLFLSEAKQSSEEEVRVVPTVFDFEDSEYFFPDVAVHPFGAVAALSPDGTSVVYASLHSPELQLQFWKLGKRSSSKHFFPDSFSVAKSVSASNGFAWVSNGEVVFGSTSHQPFAKIRLLLNSRVTDEGLEFPGCAWVDSVPGYADEAILQSPPCDVPESLGSWEVAGEKLQVLRVGSTDDNKAIGYSRKQAVPLNFQGLDENVRVIDAEYPFAALVTGNDSVVLWDELKQQHRTLKVKASNLFVIQVDCHGCFAIVEKSETGSKLQYRSFDGKTLSGFDLPVLSP